MDHLWLAHKVLRPCCTYSQLCTILYNNTIDTRQVSDSVRLTVAGAGERCDGSFVFQDEGNQREAAACRCAHPQTHSGASSRLHPKS